MGELKKQIRVTERNRKIVSTIPCGARVSFLKEGEWSRGQSKCFWTYFGLILIL